MRHSLPATFILITVSALTLAGCSAAPPEASPDDSELESPVAHAHALVNNPIDTGFLLGTHDGIFAVSPEGELGITQGAVQAITVTPDGDVMLVDDSGISLRPANQ
ncbi:hypothetical protein ACWPKO_26785 (plasmid) [Coraliomargarita sp. W4R53]